MDLTDQLSQSHLADPDFLTNNVPPIMHPNLNPVRLYIILSIVLLYIFICFVVFCCIKTANTGYIKLHGLLQNSSDDPSMC